MKLICWKSLGFSLVALIVAAFVPAYAQEIPAPKPQAAAMPSILTLEEVTAWALEKSPVLAAYDSRASAASASRLEARALPNPEVSIEAENIYGDGPYDGFDGAEVTYGVSQLLEFPGKRGNRVKVAEAANTKLHYSRDAARLNLIRDITVAYAEVVAAQQGMAILSAERALATEVHDKVSAKVDAGKEPLIQKKKAEIERSASEIALERAGRTLNAKRETLQALMGGDKGNFLVTTEGLPSLTEPQPLENYRARLMQTPDVKSLDADIAQAQSALALERANAVPDPTFNFGVRDFREDDAQALVAGVSFPIPVFNMNRAGVQRAGHELNAAVMDQRGTQLSIDALLTEVYGGFVSAYSEATALKATLLPGAEEAFSFAREGYDAGKFGYLEVLDAQRTLFDARKQLNDAVLDYHRQRAIIERMTAIHAENEHITIKENEYGPVQN